MPVEGLGNPLLVRMSLVRAYFPEMDEPGHVEMVTRLLATGKTRKIVTTTALREVLQSADLEDPNDFDDLRTKLQDQDREEIILKRMGGTKSAASFHTPNVIKNLRPNAAGCTLMFQPSRNAFQGYYKRNLPPSADKRLKPNWSTWSSFGPKRSQHAALRYVVAFLWGKHQDAGQDRIRICCWWCLCFLYLFPFVLATV